MIKAVFFDPYHTLVRYDPPREELQSRVLQEFNIKVEPEALNRPIVAADEFIYQEIARTPLVKRSEKEKMSLYMQYQRILLQKAGIEATEPLVLGILGKMQQFKMKLVLFDDVVPALTNLKNKGLILGLISNIDRDITTTLSETGLSSLLQIVITSLDTGFNKPQPEIFLEALQRARVQPNEAVYVGDQYQIDVVGANRAGLKGIFLDRGNYFEETTDYPRIQNLNQLPEHLGK